MFLELLRKEFIEKKTKESQSTLALILSSLLRFLLLGCFVALLVFVFYTLDFKIQKYSTYGTFDFLVLYLFVTAVLGVLFTMVKARASIFDKKDSRVTMILPISPSTQVFAKVVYLYIESALLQLLVSSPVLMTYGVIRTFIPYYHIFSLLYPFIISFFLVGVSLLAALVYQQFYRLIKKSDIAQIIVASILVILLCYLYQFVLNLFLTALNDSSIGGVFSPDFVNTLHKARIYFLPVYNLIDAVIEKMNTRSDIFLFAGSSLLSLTLGVGIVSIVYYHEIKNETYPVDNKKHEHKKLPLLTPFKALLKKEFAILFTDEANLFSYTSLLIMCPFLTFAVISSLNGIIYDNLRFYAAYFPELVNGINLTLVLLFVGVINASASLSMTREGKSLIVVKTIPVSPLKQIFAKLLIPFAFSELSLFITEIVLISTSIITWKVLLTSFVIGTLLLAFSNVFGIYADMKDMSSKRRRVKVTLINEIVPILLPIVIFLLFFLFSVVISLPSYSLYLIAIGFTLLIFLPFLIGLKRRYSKSFVEMEVHN